MSAAGSNYLASRKSCPEINLPASVNLELKANGTNCAVRLINAEAGGNMLFQEPPEPVAGSLELPESGGIILKSGDGRSLGHCDNSFAGFIGQTVEAVLRRAATRIFPACARHNSGTRARHPGFPTDRIAMQRWWFNSSNTLKPSGYNLVTIRSTDVTRATALTAQLKNDGFLRNRWNSAKVANQIVTVTVMFTLVGSIALLVAIGIANTMVMAIYERTWRNRHSQGHARVAKSGRCSGVMEAYCIGFIWGLAYLFFGWLVGLGLNQAIQALFEISRPAHARQAVFRRHPDAGAGSD